jgi:S-adenosylmethionine uptake transporter
MTKGQKYMLGIAWFILSLVISNLNDVIAKYVGSDLHFAQTTFCRCFFGMLSLLPFMIYGGIKSFKTPRPIMHVIRGSLLYFGIAIWILGLNLVPIATATIMTFTIPLFILIMAPIFLGEKVSARLWIATLVGFVGVIIVFNPSHDTFQPISLILLLSSLMFATLDIINKKYVVKESMLSMLFYSAVVTSVLGFYPAYMFWQDITTHQLVLLAILGAGSNLILYCLLKAFSFVQASAVAPYRYLELVLSAFVGFVVFSEIPAMATYIGTLIIVPCTLYVASQQIKWENR